MSWDDIAAKLVRSGEHLQHLVEATHSYLEGPDNGIVNDFDSEPNYLLVKAYSHTSPPTRVAVIIGEFLYQMRSSLDHLACLLTQANGGVCDTRVEFPIYTKEVGFGELGNPKSWNYARIGRIAMEFQHQIEREQPFTLKYATIEADPLTWLYELSNIDRHRFLHVIATSARESTVEVEPAAARERLLLVDSQLGPVHAEREILRYMILKGPEVRDMSVHSQVRLNLAFAEGPIANTEVTFVLGSIGERVGELIQRFRLAGG